MLRADADAQARGAISWQAADDLVDVDFFHAAGEGPPTNNNRSRDFQHQWVDFWGANHIKRVSGPRGSGAGLRARFRVKLRPGHVEPGDLILDPEYHPGRDRLTFGADLLRQGINGGVARSGAGLNQRPRPSGRPASQGTIPY
jgi:hypothetical protein